MKKCPFCGRMNDDRAKVCETCRAAMEVQEKQEKPASQNAAGSRIKQRSEKYGS